MLRRPKINRHVKKFTRSKARRAQNMKMTVSHLTQEVLMNFKMISLRKNPTATEEKTVAARSNNQLRLHRVLLQTKSENQASCNYKRKTLRLCKIRNCAILKCKSSQANWSLWNQSHSRMMIYKTLYKMIKLVEIQSMISKMVPSNINHIFKVYCSTRTKSFKYQTGET